MEPGTSSERRDLWGEALSKAQAVKVRNVMNPLLWLNAVAMPLLLSAAYMFQDQIFLSSLMGASAAGLPIWTMWEYRYFARTDPRRLHSEEYLLEQERLMIQSKSWTQGVDATYLPSGGNPELIQNSSAASLPSALDTNQILDRPGFDHE